MVSVQPEHYFFKSFVKREGDALHSLVKEGLIAKITGYPAVAPVLGGVEAGNGVGLDYKGAGGRDGHVPADVGDFGCQRNRRRIIAMVSSQKGS